MQALPSAFFHQVSSASRIFVPRAWMAKSTMRRGAAERRRARAGLEIVGASRAAERHVEMRVRVDAAGQARTFRRHRSPSAADSPESRRAPRWIALAFDQHVGRHRLARALTTVPFRINSVHADCPHTSAFSAPSSAPGRPGLHLLHRDAVLHRAHQPAQIAAHALGLIHARNARRRSVRPCAACAASSLAIGVTAMLRAAGRFHASPATRVAVEMDALVRAVPAGDVAEVAADALVAIDARDDLVIQVEMLPLRHPAAGSARENRRCVRKPFSSIQLLRPSIMSSTMR